MTGPLPLLPCAVANDARWFTVEGPGQTTAVRRAAVELGTDLGMPERRLNALTLLATELTSNLHKHAREGAVLVRSLRHEDGAAVQIVAVDAGPGMGNPIESARDGHSTTGTLGIGLSAIGRQATWCEMYSLPGVGTVAVTEVWSDGVPRSCWAHGVNRPITGETVCGDGFASRTVGSRGQVMLCDGLGHGRLAEAVTRTAIRAFAEAPELGPAAVVEHLHRSLTGTRGAAVMVAEVDQYAGVLRVAGLGNIAGFMVTPGQRRQLVTLPGIAGHQRRTVREFHYALQSDAVIILHSDGLTDRWSLDQFPGLITKSPTTIAASLLRTAAVRRDDACVVVAKTAP